MMRLFLAVPIQEPLRAALAGVMDRLKSADADVRWVTPENLHLTVSFLGDRTEGQLAPIEELAKRVAESTAPFRIRLRGASAFPVRGPLKTLWVGVADGAAEWKALAKRAEAEFAAFGTPPGNDLVPHITLGRVKSPKGMDTLRTALTAEAQTDCGEQPADTLVLVKSTLDPAGAVYQELKRWNFQHNGAS